MSFRSARSRSAAATADRVRFFLSVPGADCASHCRSSDTGSMGRSSASACLEMMRVYCDEEVRDEVEQEAAEGDGGAAAAGAEVSAAAAATDACFVSVVINEAEG